jgi:hypothetical protein
MIQLGRGAENDKYVCKDGIWRQEVALARQLRKSERVLPMTRFSQIDLVGLSISIIIHDRLHHEAQKIKVSRDVLPAKGYMSIIVRWYDG